MRPAEVNPLTPPAPRVSTTSARTSVEHRRHGGVLRAIRVDPAKVLVAQLHDVGVRR